MNWQSHFLQALEGVVMWMMWMMMMNQLAWSLGIHKHHLYINAHAIVAL